MAFFGSDVNINDLIQKYIVNNGLLKAQYIQNSTSGFPEYLTFNVPKRPVYIWLEHYADGHYWTSQGFGGLGVISTYGYYEDGAAVSRGAFECTWAKGVLTVRQYPSGTMHANFRAYVFYVP
jgi:hypothetical protein